MAELICRAPSMESLTQEFRTEDSHGSDVGNTEPTSLRVRSRAWCWTSFGDTPPHYDENICDYLAYAPEICPTTNRKHWQWYAHFKYAVPATVVINRIQVCYAKIAHGTPQENRDYIFGPYKKGDKEKPVNPDAVEFGTLPKQGKRTDIINIVDCIRAGDSDAQILEEHGDKALRLLNYIDKARSTLSNVKRNWPMSVLIFWGDPGTGKSRYAHEHYPDLYVKDESKWWDGYKGQDTVLVDDFYCASSEIPLVKWLMILDRYPMQVQVKGGFVEFVSKTIIFTSNLDPTCWWWGLPQKAAWDRRINTIIKFPFNG